MPCHSSYTVREQNSLMDWPVFQTTSLPSVATYIHTYNSVPTFITLRLVLCTSWLHCAKCCIISNIHTYTSVHGPLFRCIRPLGGVSLNKTKSCMYLTLGATSSGQVAETDGTTEFCLPALNVTTVRPTKSLNHAPHLPPFTVIDI